MPWPQAGATQYHPQLGLLDKGRAIKAFGPANNSLALGCYQPSPDVFIVWFTKNTKYE